MAGSGNGARERDFYEKLRRTVTIWAGGEGHKSSRYADLILASPDLFMLVARLARDERLSPASRAKLAGAVAYFINPLDLMPEMLLGPAGLIDDVALAAYVLHDLLESTDPAIIREYWSGKSDVLDLIRAVLLAADTMLGGPVWRRIVARAQSFVPTSAPRTGPRPPGR